MDGSRSKKTRPFKNKLRIVKFDYNRANNLIQSRFNTLSKRIIITSGYTLFSIYLKKKVVFKKNNGYIFFISGGGGKSPGFFFYQLRIINTIIRKERGCKRGTNGLGVLPWTRDRGEMKSERAKGNLVAFIN